MVFSLKDIMDRKRIKEIIRGSLNSASIPIEFEEIGDMKVFFCKDTESDEQVLRVVLDGYDDGDEVSIYVLSNLIEETKVVDLPRAMSDIRNHRMVVTVQPSRFITNILGYEVYASLDKYGLGPSVPEGYFGYTKELLQYGVKVMTIDTAMDEMIIPSKYLWIAAHEDLRLANTRYERWKDLLRNNHVSLLLDQEINGWLVYHGEPN